MDTDPQRHGSTAQRSVRAIVRHTWLGWALVGFAAGLALAVKLLWDVPIEGFGWRMIALMTLVGGVILLALVEELGRPQNPYKNIDPRFSYMDAGPTGHLVSASSSWLWHALPPAVAAGLIVVSWLVT